MNTNNAPDIIIRPSAAITFCTPKSKERARLAADQEAFLNRGGVVQIFDSPTYSPYLNSTPRSLYEFCNTEPRKKSVVQEKITGDFIAIWKVAAAFGVKTKIKMDEFRAKVGREYPNADLRKDGGKGSSRLYWKYATVARFFGENILDEARGC